MFSPPAVAVALTPEMLTDMDAVTGRADAMLTTFGALTDGAATTCPDEAVDDTP